MKGEAAPTALAAGLSDRAARPAPLGWPDRLVEAGGLFLLVFTPLAYGTVEPWSEAVAELVVLGMVVTWLLGMALGHWEVRVELPPGWLPAALFLLLVAVQATPLPVALARLVSPWTAGLHEAAAAQLGLPPAAVPASLAPHETWREGLKLGAVAAFFLVCANVYRTRAQAARAVWTMVLVGAGVAVFGIVQRVTWNGRFYWIGPEAPHASAFGPFVNRAHFAGLMVVVVPMALGLMLGQADARRARHPHGWPDRLRRWVGVGAGPARLVPVLVVLAGGASLVSGSRGGLVALLAALVAMVGLGVERRRRRGRVARLALAAAMIVLAGLWIGADALLGTAARLAEEVGRPAESPRLGIWRDALALGRASPLVGSGLASFDVAFRTVRTLADPVAYTHAESDWIQLLTDTGALGLGLAAWALAALGAALLGVRRRATAGWARTLALGALVALLGAAVQGVGNFTLALASSGFSLAAALAVGTAGTGAHTADRPPRDAGVPA